jgi:hypothetical protein
MTFIIQDPWSDKQCIKNGLVFMYIADSLSRCLSLSAYIDDVAMPNPKHSQLLLLVKNFLDKPDSFSYNNLLTFCDSPPLSDHISDIRNASSIDQCLTWLKDTYLAD